MPYAVKNSLEIADKIKDIVPLFGSILFSFDIARLFPLLPVGPILQFTLVAQNKYVVADWMCPLKVYLSPNICQFDYGIYTLPDGIGVPVGCPLGSLLENVVKKVVTDSGFIFELMTTESKNV